MFTIIWCEVVVGQYEYLSVESHEIVRDTEAEVLAAYENLRSSSVNPDYIYIFKGKSLKVKTSLVEK